MPTKRGTAYLSNASNTGAAIPLLGYPSDDYRRISFGRLGWNWKETYMINATYVVTVVRVSQQAIVGDGSHLLVQVG